MIEIKDLKKSFGPKQVLKDINLKIEEGKTTCILGGSGSGKSTLIKCLIGLEEATDGHIWVDGKDITKIHSEIKLAAIRRKFGYLFQEGALFDSMSVGENVTFGLKYLTEVPESEYPKVIKEKLALVGLKEDVAKLNPSELSGGMKKRVSLARVLAVEPKVILYDEPTTGLDPIMSDIISDLIIGLKAKLGVTSVVITHDMRSAFKIADYIAFLYEGHILMYGTPEEFKKTDNPYVKQFVEGSSQGPIQMQLLKA
ncbi:ATP-binding cassette domain-containing protein [Candidatus Avelusimicrobium fimicolum]|uniref:ABC transporter ATP-binding protein n=1 Tax=Candidatus Avelusimicrobium TaxID=2840538 RepID=UPI0015ABA710|nr:ABC transporter ATP-binding protein [Spirochaetia bacterium]